MTTSVNNCKTTTSQNNVTRTTDRLNTNGVINDDIAGPTRKNKFIINITLFNLDSTETKFNNRKKTPFLVICEFDISVSNEAVEGFSSKSSSVDFNVVIDKPSRQESPRSSKYLNCLVTEVGQTVEHSNEQVNIRKEIQYIPTKTINTAGNNSVKQNNEEWRKGTTLILGDSTISGLIEKKVSRNKKIKVRFFPGAEIKDYHYAINLLEKKPENIILHSVKNDAFHKAGTNILKNTIELMCFDLKKLPSCNKIRLSSPAVYTNKVQRKIMKFLQIERKNKVYLK